MVRSDVFTPCEIEKADMDNAYITSSDAVIISVIQ